MLRCTWPCLPARRPLLLLLLQLLLWLRPSAASNPAPEQRPQPRSAQYLLLWLCAWKPGPWLLPGLLLRRRRRLLLLLLHHWRRQCSLGCCRRAAGPRMTVALSALLLSHCQGLRLLSLPAAPETGGVRTATAKAQWQAGAEGGAELKPHQLMEE